MIIMELYWTLRYLVAPGYHDVSVSREKVRLSHTTVASVSHVARLSG